MGTRHLRRKRAQGKRKANWREAKRRRRLQTATQPGVMPTIPSPGPISPLAPWMRQGLCGHENPSTNPTARPPPPQRAHAPAVVPRPLGVRKSRSDRAKGHRLEAQAQSHKESQLPDAEEGLGRGARV